MEEQEGLKDSVKSVPLDRDGDGEDDSVVAQQSQGREAIEGGGEFPDPEAPSQRPAPGSDS